jgi:SAM-dependent methyltransferase
MNPSLLDRVVTRTRIATQGQLKCFDLIRSLVKGKKGIEIGGPSDVFREAKKLLPIYQTIGSLDNCDFSKSTTWAAHADTYTFSPTRPAGKTIFGEGSNLAGVPDASYDFVLSSHNLEHFANPVKALKEWQRVSRPGGSLILVLPNYHYTFDHQRTPTSVAHMFDDFNRDVQEDDLTHLDEILLQHNLGRDAGAGSPEAFHKRSLDNMQNRCLHHHVFDVNNCRTLLSQVGAQVLAVETAWPWHIFLVATFPTLNSVEPTAIC